MKYPPILFPSVCSIEALHLLLFCLLTATVSCQVPPPPSPERATSPTNSQAKVSLGIDACSPQVLSDADSQAREHPTDPQTQAAAGEVLRACFESSKDIYIGRRAANAYIRAAELTVKGGDVRYTREVSELLASLGNSDQLRKVFDAFLKSEAAEDQGRRYLVLVDYADALAALGIEEDAWTLFDQAIQLRPQNNIEAVNRYARRLIERGQPERAAELIESTLTRDQRLRHVLPAYLWREALHKSGKNTVPADEEIRIIEARRG